MFLLPSALLVGKTFCTVGGKWAGSQSASQIHLLPKPETSLEVEGREEVLVSNLQRAHGDYVMAALAIASRSWWIVFKMGSLGKVL